MFDPTAYDNLKVILEGLVYDYDLAGEIIVTKRNDLVNLADLSRTFQIHFSLTEDRKQIVDIKMELAANVRNFFPEWAPVPGEPGARLVLVYTIFHPLNDLLQRRTGKWLQQHFGRQFDMNFVKQIDMKKNEATVFTLHRISPVTEDSTEELKETAEKAIQAGRTVIRMAKE